MRPHALRRNGFFYYYLTDHLGSVIGVDSQAVVKNAYEYDAWGWTEFDSEQVENRFRFAGRECDLATDLYYLRARYYDPATGRFLSEDPLGLAAGLNPYAYAGNSPITVRDPSGLQGDLETDRPDCTDPDSPGGEEIVEGDTPCTVEGVVTCPTCGSTFISRGRPQGAGPMWVSGGGVGGGGGSGSTGSDSEEKNENCTRAIANLAFNFALDASTVLGYGAVVRLGKAATFYRRVARTRGLNGGWLRGGQDAMAGAQVIDRIQAETFDSWMRSSVGPSAIGKAGFISVLGGNVNWQPSFRGVMEFLTDVAPVVSTIKSGIQVVRACT